MPTIQQRKAFKEVVKGSTLTSAMVKAGYSQTTAKRTNKLTRTKGWKELIEKCLSDNFLANKHRELLNKKETIRFYDEETKTTKIKRTKEIDAQAVAKGLEMAYKIKGSYAPEKSVALNLNINDEHKGKSIQAIKEFLDRGDS